MFKALIIGCGNIGALYDYNNEQILTHAKGYSLHEKFSFDVFDSDKEKANHVAKKYNIPIQPEVSTKLLRSYGSISICTPTNLHKKYLSMCFHAEVPLVICEKPVSYDLQELQQIEKEYNTAKTKVIVNYIRRFSPTFRKIKEDIAGILPEEKLRYINIRYNRGFINNCSHAFDLIEYLFDEVFEIKNIQILSSAFDFFENDPTLSLLGDYNDAKVFVNGFEGINYPTFEIDLLFDRSFFKVLKSGNIIEIYKDGTLKEEYKNGIENYMKPVIEHAADILSKSDANDNFANSIILNIKMLNILKLL